ncbi:hypothetical protein NBRC116493_24650 [Aurantivibrio infirmus]
MVAPWNIAVKIKASTQRFYAVFFALLFVLGLSSCDSNTINSPNENQGPRLEAISFKQWEQQLSDYQSKIVVVDLWAMWCTSCIERFPQMVEMHDAYKQQNVQFVSLNLDDRDDTESVNRAGEFLVKVNAEFDNFHMNENLIDAFDRFKLIGIPAVLIYDGKGVERYRLTNDNPSKQFGEEDIESAIKTLLAEA